MGDLKQKLTAGAEKNNVAFNQKRKNHYKGEFRTAKLKMKRINFEKKLKSLNLNFIKKFYVQLAPCINISDFLQVKLSK